MNKEKVVTQTTWIGLFINLALSGIKFFFGTVGHSQALIADAFHSFSDLITDFAILIGVKHWSKPPDDEHPHGHERIEILVTGAIGLFLILVAGGIFWKAICNLIDKNFIKPNFFALGAAVISIFIKEALYQYTKFMGNKVDSSALIANAWHHRTDALSSIPAAASIILSEFVPGFQFIDSLGAIIVSFFIFIPAFTILKPALSKLIDRGASQQLIDRIIETSLKVDGVMGIHDVKTRFMTSNKILLELHIEVKGDLSVLVGHQIGKDVKERVLKEHEHIKDILIHVDPYELAKELPKKRFTPD